ncbi:group-specific protein [Planococcus salinus]|uniref:Group-specific protein n=2 Tax=Planococcus salinus TaxID=1848460 RepID=A0A3M8PAL0_9BACL|nr:group-specific protein [Planococcus salinus]
MGYPGNGDGLYFASHIGLKIYQEGKWFETADNFHDYMGFNAIDEGFYTSGHPSAASDLPNPLGIQRSLDGGESIEEIAFQGETDFHAMAVGYNTHDIFLLNPAKNSLLEAGFYKSNDEGESWEPVKASGLEGEVSALALHPTDSNFVAAATSAGVYFSRDAGENFEAITAESETGTAVHFAEDHLYFGSFGKTSALMKYTIENEEQEMLNIPDLPEDAIAFIAQNPNDEMELAIYTLQGQAYRSENGTQSWNSLLENGNTI